MTGSWEYLPSADEQATLIDSLERLLRDRGTHQFLSMPLVEPTRRFFPDPWSFSIQGLDRVTRRLMQYADLGDLQVRIGTFANPGYAATRKGLDAATSVAGAFLGLNSGCAYFAFNESAPADPEYMAGVMAHEVAHAYRAFHHLSEAAVPAQEEPLTDVTGAYLGFGLLLANNSYRYRTGGEVRGVFSSWSASTHQVGYLTPQSFAYLLAIQLHARGLDDRETRRILKHLEADQSAFTKAALDSIRGWPEETFRRLQFPAEGDPIPDVPLGSILVPLTEIVVTSPDLQPPPGDEEVLDALPNSGFPVFRLQQTKAIWYSLLGCFAGFALGSFVAVVLRSLWVQITAPVAGLALGWIRGNSERWDICSDPVCKTTIPLEAATCPGCGGLVAGSIRSSSERLDAEEEFERRNKPKRRPMKRRKPTSRPPRPQ